MDFCDLLNIFIMLAELLIIETKLIHKVGSHLLDLVIGESLRCKKKITMNISAQGGTSGDLMHVFCMFPTCWRDRSLGKGLSMSSSSLEECMLWVLTWKIQTVENAFTKRFCNGFLIKRTAVLVLYLK